VEFDKLVIVGVGESFTIWLLWAWGRVRQTGYCGREGELEKLFIVGVGRVCQTGDCGRGGECVKLVIVGVG
jgi:hypothetical protein